MKIRIVLILFCVCIGKVVYGMDASALQDNFDQLVPTSLSQKEIETFADIFKDQQMVFALVDSLKKEGLDFWNKNFLNSLNKFSYDDLIESKAIDFEGKKVLCLLYQYSVFERVQQYILKLLETKQCSKESMKIFYRMTWGVTMLWFAKIDNIMLLIRALISNNYESLIEKHNWLINMPISFVEELIISPLMATLMSYKFEEAHRLVKKGAYVDWQNSAGQTTLHYIYQQNNKCFFDEKYDAWFSFYDINVNLQDYSGESVAWMAVKFQNESFLDFLLKKGLDLNIKSFMNGKTVLMVAAEKCSWFFNKSLLILGADATICDDEGKRPEDYAQNQCIRKLFQAHEAMKNFLEKESDDEEFEVGVDEFFPESITLDVVDEFILEILSRAWISPEEKRPRLLLRTTTRHPDKIAILLNHLCNDKFLRYIYRRIHTCKDFMRGHIVCTKALYWYSGFYARRMLGEDGLTALNHLIESVFCKGLFDQNTWKRFLKDYPWLVNVPCIKLAEHDTFETLLTCAIQKSCKPMVQLLLQHGADITCKSSDGLSSLELVEKMINQEHRIRESS